MHWFLRYFMMMNYNHTTVWRTDISSRKIVLYGCNSMHGCFSNTLLIHPVKTFFRPVQVVLNTESSMSAVFTSGLGLIIMLPVLVDIKSTLAWMCGLTMWGTSNFFLPATMLAGHSAILFLSSNCSVCALAVWWGIISGMTEIHHTMAKMPQSS